MAVAGYVWPFAKWASFQRRWRRFLRDNDLEFFHMTDFENYQGPYKNWTVERHNAAIKRIVRIITESKPYGVCAAVMLDDYDAFSQDDKARTGSPYMLCGSWCIGLVANWLEEQGIPEPVAYVFELGDETQANLREEILRLTASEDIPREDSRAIPVL